ncbi:MAG: ion transporter [Cytophagales bacterium]
MKILKLKQKISSVLEPGNKRDRHAGYFDVFIEMLVLVNVVAVILESFEQIEAQFHYQLDLFEIFTVTIFSIELLLRIWISDIRYPAKTKWLSIKRFLTTPTSWIDILAIMPFFMPYWLNVDLRHLRVLRLVRLMRVFKLAKYSQAMIHIGKIITEKRQELLATFLLMFSILVLSSSVMYYVEHDAQPTVFPNILYAFWWGVITLTTVGYGDAYPITALGKIIGGMVALMGVLIVAIPTGIISSSFVQKMEESKSIKRMREIRKKLKEAFYKKYIPELGTKVRRGQLSVDAVKVNLELSENDVYKIAEGKNEFRFRYKKVLQNGNLVDKLFLEYREINSNYGTFTNRNTAITIVSPESLKKQSIGYFSYCIAEKLKCNFISNEFFGDESTALEESFGDSGLEEDTAFSFIQNVAYLKNFYGDVPDNFLEWKDDLKKLARKDTIFLVFNTFEKAEDNASLFNLYYLNNNKEEQSSYTFDNLKNLGAFRNALMANTKEKYGYEPIVAQNASWANMKDNNILYFLHNELEADVIVINILQELISSDRIFSFAAIFADSIKEELILNLGSE